MLPIPPDAALQVDGLAKAFRGHAAVCGVSLRVAPGELLVVAGPSGAGKSTLLRMINRLVEPDAGSVRLGDLDVSRLRGAGLRKWRARCAMVFQHFHLIERLDAATNVLVGGIAGMGALRGLAGVFTRAERLRAAEALERVGMLSFALRRCGELSGGQKQRVAIARALIQNPAVLLADEPVSSLDPRSSVVVMDLIEEICRERKIRVIVNLHDIALARRYGDRIVGLQAGKAIFDGPAKRFTEQQEARLFGAEGARSAHGQREVAPLGSSLEVQGLVRGAADAV